MRITIPTLVFALLAPAGLAQEPDRPVTPPAPVVKTDADDNQKDEQKQDPKPTSRPTDAPAPTVETVTETNVVGIEDKTEEELPAGGGLVETSTADTEPVLPPLGAEEPPPTDLA